MKIAIDISQIVHRGAGVARYTKELTKALLKYDHRNQYVFFFSSLRQKMDKNLKKEIEKKHFLKEFFLPPTVLDLLWNQWHIFSIDNLVGKNDLLLTSDWIEPPSQSKKITVIHDLVSLKYPEESHPRTEFALKNFIVFPNIVTVQKRRLSWVKKESALIISDSFATKNDIIELLKVPEDKIEVIYPPVEINIPTNNEVRKTTRKYQIRKPFILTVGKIEPRKNLRRLINAFKKAKLNDVDLIIVGPKGWNKTIKQGNNSTIKHNNIKFLGFIPDIELYSLYQSALFFIYPSIYEGFGYPIVEAMKLKCPIATSDTSSLKEIAENVALLFNPYNENAIAQAIVTLYQNPNLRKELYQKAIKRAKQFSLEKYAHNLIRTFERFHKLN